MDIPFFRIPVLVGAAVLTAVDILSVCVYHRIMYWRDSISECPVSQIIRSKWSEMKTLPRLSDQISRSWHANKIATSRLTSQFLSFRLHQARSRRVWRRNSPQFACFCIICPTLASSWHLPALSEVYLFLSLHS